jgi:hypothetical protein
MRREPVMRGRQGKPFEANRQRGMVARTLVRQDVELDGAADQLVAEVDRSVRPKDEHSVCDPLFQAGREIRIECALGFSGSRGGTGRRPDCARFVRGRDVGQLIEAERAAGRSEQPENPAALVRSECEPRDHEILERPGQRRARQLPACGQELLREQRAAARPLRDENEDRGGRPLALDALDQPRDVIAAERPDLEALRGPRRLREAGDLRDERVRPGQLTRLVRRDQAEALVPGDPGEERDQCAGGRVGVVEVLHGQHDRPPLAEPADRAEHRFEESRLAALRGRDGRPRGQHPERGQPRAEVRQQADHVFRAGREDGAELPVGQLAEQRPDRPEDRGVRLVGAGRERSAAQECEWLRQCGEPQLHLREEARRAVARPTGHEECRRATLCRRVEGRGKPRERSLPSDETRAREARRHGAF